MNRFHLLGLILVINLCGTLFATNTKNAKASFKDIKRVKIVVSQSYGKAKDVTLPFFDVTSRLLELAGATVVKEDSQGYDAVLEINAKGEAIKGYYTKNGELLFTPFPVQEIQGRREHLYRSEREPDDEEIWEFFSGLTELDIPSQIKVIMPYRLSYWETPSRYIEEILYTGAYLTGTITLRSNDGREIKEEFEGFIPPTELNRNFFSYSSSTFFPFEPGRAPFYDAFSDNGSFLDKIALVIGKAFGAGSLIPGLKDPDVKVYISVLRALEEMGGCAVQSLVAELESSDINLRNHIVSILSRIQDPALFEPLIRTLKDESPEIRWKSAKALGKLGDKRAVEPLLEALEDNTIEVRIKSARSLGQLADPRAVEKLAKVAQDGKEDSAVRKEAIIALGKIGGDEAVNVLINLLEKSKETIDFPDDLRSALIKALGYSQDVKAIPILIELWRRGPYSDAICFALAKIGTPVVQTILPLFTDKAFPAYRRAGLAKALGKIGDKRAVESLVASLGEEDFSLRRAVIWALFKLGEASVPALLSALNSDNLRVKADAVEVLGYIKSESAIEPLSVLLYDGKLPLLLRQAVAKALAKIDTPSAMEVLLKVVKNKEVEEELRVTSLWLLDFENQSVVEELEKLVKDKEENYLVRKAAIQRLVEVKYSMIFECLLSIINDSDEKEFIKTFCIRQLGELGNEKTGDILLSLAKSKPSLIKPIALALADLGDLRAIPYLVSVLEESFDGSDYQVINAIKFLRAPQGYPEFLKLCRSSNPKLRQLGAELLGFVPTEESLNTLLSLLKDEYPAVRQSASLSLGRLGRFQATEPLINALKDSYAIVRETAVQALGDIGDKRAVEAILPILQDPNPNIRRNAIIALGKLGDPRALNPLLNIASDFASSHSRVDVWVIEEVHKALVRIGKPAVEALIIILSNREADALMRKLAVVSLTDIGDVRAVEPLINAFEELTTIRWLRREQLSPYLIYLGLKRITNQDFGWNLDLWRKWWERQKKLVQKGG